MCPERNKLTQNDFSSLHLFADYSYAIQIPQLWCLKKAKRRITKIIQRAFMLSTTIRFNNKLPFAPSIGRET